MIAHIREADHETQTVSAHCRRTAELCAAVMGSLDMNCLGFLCGLLHDMGKCSKAWQGYLFRHADSNGRTAKKGDIHHAPVGAIFAYERWYAGDRAAKMAAQLIAMSVYGHHSGLTDAVSIGGDSPLIEKLSRDKDELFYAEAVENYLEEVCCEDELDALFQAASDEIRAKKHLIDDFAAGLLLRALFGALIDADRYDSACFEYREEPVVTSPMPNWAAGAEALDRTLARFPRTDRLSVLRGEISDACFAAADTPKGLLRLTVPTGGSKTLSSLRFGLRNAEHHSMNRIFYIIPFNTILDQNARDIRNALEDTVSILEHHGNVVLDEASDDDFSAYRKLTERWRSDIVLTSMVQFLNAFYRVGNADARRMSGLFNAVLIFDEVQALPKHCVRLFEKAIGFLTSFCGCTVVLCTATQPQFLLNAREMMPDPQRLFRVLRRTYLIDESRVARSTESAAGEIERLIGRHGAVLMIVNTRKMAHRMYDLASALGIPSLHLSNDMVPAHRLALIDQIKSRDPNQPLFCVSTALIEAGINISFPCVVRSLAGLGSILQAAGRCNRNAELPEGVLGEVHIWNLADENLTGLQEIADAQMCTRGLFAARGARDADMPEGIRAYYAIEREKFVHTLPYTVTVSGVQTTLLDLFGKNTVSGGANGLVLRGAYRTAEESFRAIDAETRTVLVDRGRGADIVKELAASPSMNRTKSLLREAQRYSLSLFFNVFQALEREGAIWQLEESGVCVLRGAYYNETTGLTHNAQRMEDLQY